MILTVYVTDDINEIGVNVNWPFDDGDDLENDILFNKIDDLNVQIGWIYILAEPYEKRQLPLPSMLSCRLSFLQNRYDRLIAQIEGE